MLYNYIDYIILGVATLIILGVVYFLFFHKRKSVEPKQEDKWTIPMIKAFGWRPKVFKRFMEWRPKKMIPKGCQMFYFNKDGTHATKDDHELAILALNRKNAKRKLSL